MKAVRLSWGSTLGLLWLVCSGPDQAFSQQPDPVALLRGIAQAREPLAGRMRISVVQKRLKPQPVEDTKELEVEFDRDSRRFIQHQTILAVSSKQPNAGEKLKALGGDIKTAAARGIGRLEQCRFLSVYDGSQFASFDGSNGAYILNPDAGQLHYCFDPRVFGIARSHMIGYTLNQCLGLEDNGVMSVVGQERIGDRLVWHVKVSKPKSEVDYHFWVEDEKGFRVHRFEYKWPPDGSKIHLVASSEYSGRSRPPLPSRVVVEETNSGVRQWETVFTVTEADYKARPDPAVFGLKGLEMPPGMTVIDERVHRVAGYWTGAELSPDYLQAKEIGAGLAAAEQVTAKRWAMVRTSSIVAGIALVILVGSVVAYRRLARHRLA